MKLGQFLPAKKTLEHLAQARGLAAVTSLRLARYWRTIGPELDAYERERIRLVHELGERDGDEVRVKPENHAEFKRQTDAMLEEEIHLAIKPFDMLDFQKAGLSPEDIIILEAAGLLTVDWDIIDAEGNETK
jgi:hypothetical protein